MAKNEISKIMKDKIAVAEKYSFINDALIKYGLLRDDSNKFEDRGLEFNHLDIDTPDYEDDEEAYYERVSLWFDFITAIHYEYGLEPILLTENKSIPNVRFILKTLQGVNPVKCKACSGKGLISDGTISGYDLCDSCQGLGIEVFQTKKSEE